MTNAKPATDNKLPQMRLPVAFISLQRARAMSVANKGAEHTMNDTLVT